MMNVDFMASIDRLADMMASGKATVPQHLRGNKADCYAICLQALQWGMNPFPVAQKTHLVNGTLGYEAQLVNAVVVNSGVIKGRFDYEFFGP
ncbi:MAG: recombinase RecT, partial [Plesiomonas shigelloides]